MLEVIKISQEDVPAIIKAIHDMIISKENSLCKKLFIKTDHSHVGIIIFSKFHNTFILRGGIYSTTLDGNDHIYNRHLVYNNDVSIESVAFDIVQSLNDMYQQFGYDYKVEIPDEFKDELIKAGRELSKLFDYCFFIPEEFKKEK